MGYVCIGSTVLSQDSTLDGTVQPVSSLVGIPKRIAFGSCAHQDKPQPVLERVVEQSPEIFIYLGDNIYGDSRNMHVLQAKYAKLAAKPEFQSLRKKVAVLSIWDDHDYGENDSGSEYPFHKESREIFLDFWRVPADSPRRTHQGIYGSHLFESNGRTLQVVLLDTRSFRSPLKKNPSVKSLDGKYKNDYQPDPDPTKTILGETQWQWLEEQLRLPADVRIIASSIQFGHEYNGYESWTNLPLEQERMLEIIRRTKASGVLFYRATCIGRKFLDAIFQDFIRSMTLPRAGLLRCGTRSNRTTFVWVMPSEKITLACSSLIGKSHRRTSP